MIAKDKAKELVERFRMHDIQICDLMGSELKGYEEGHYKQCALICVDETIESLRHIIGVDLMLKFWIEVKQEIEKL